MFIVYSKPSCPNCVNAKKLLTSKTLEFKEIILDVGQEKDSTLNYCTTRDLKIVVPNATSVPQILHNGELIGGFNSLVSYLKDKTITN